MVKTVHAFRLVHVRAARDNGWALSPVIAALWLSPGAHPHTVTHLVAGETDHRLA